MVKAELAHVRAALASVGVELALTEFRPANGTRKEEETRDNEKENVAMGRARTRIWRDT
jgi:hypothetical protein